MDRFTCFVCVGASLCVAASASAQIGIFDPATTASIEYRQNFTQVAPSASWSSPTQLAWQSPGSFGSGPQVDTLSAQANNSYQGGLTHSLNNLNLSGPNAWSVRVPAVVGSKISQLDPGNNFARTSLRMEFDVFFRWGGSLGTVFETPFANVNAMYNVGAGGLATLAIHIDYYSVTLGNTLLVTQSAAANFPGPAAGQAGIGAPNFGVVIPAQAGELFEIRGYIELTVDNHGGPSFIEVIPAPGAAALLGLGGLMASRRRRA